METIILASASPRRKQLLQEAGIAFEVIPADCEETHIDGEMPDAMVMRLAEMKARFVAAANPGRIVLGADTVVAMGGRTFGKPANEEEARATLQFLSGKEHQVFTGVCIVFADASVKTWCARTDVKFKTYGLDTIEKYMRLVRTSDKAGSYAIQEHGDMLVEAIDGLQSNVIGLPIEEVVSAIGNLQKQ